MYRKVISLNIKPITIDTVNWSNDLDICSPIDIQDIPGFKFWVNWHGFNEEYHRALDFAAYITQNNDIVLGLPPIKIRAVGKGRVSQIDGTYNHKAGNYSTGITIEHGELNSNMYSYYLHVIPEVEKNMVVDKGDVIGTLYIDNPELTGYKRLTHLHFEMLNSWLYDEKRDVDPGEIFPEFKSYKAIPQGEELFTVPGFENNKVITANFMNLNLKKDY